MTNLFQHALPGNKGIDVDDCLQTQISCFVYHLTLSLLAKDRVLSSICSSCPLHSFSEGVPLAAHLPTACSLYVVVSASCNAIDTFHAVSGSSLSVTRQNARLEQQPLSAGATARMQM